MTTETNLEDPAGAKDTGDGCVEHAISVAAFTALLGVGETFLCEVFQTVLVFRVRDTWAKPRDAAYFFVSFNGSE